MTLKIYTDMKDVDKDKFVLDVEKGFRYCGIKNNSYNREVIRILEKGSYVDEDTFKDRFGVLLYSSCLSTSSKAYICLHDMPDKIINFIEVGKDTGDLLLLNKEGSIYMPLNRLDSLLTSIDDSYIDVELNGIKFNSYVSLVNYIGGVL